MNHKNHSSDTFHNLKGLLFDHIIFQFFLDSKKGNKESSLLPFFISIITKNSN